MSLGTLRKHKSPFNWYDLKAGEELGIEVVPGIEISTRYLGPVHILGYYLDTTSPVLNEVSQWLVQDRDRRNRKMAALMRADGLDVD